MHLFLKYVQLGWICWLSLVSLSAQNHALKQERCKLKDFHYRLKNTYKDEGLNLISYFFKSIGYFQIHFIKPRGLVIKIANDTIFSIHVVILNYKLYFLYMSTFLFITNTTDILLKWNKKKNDSQPFVKPSF